MDSTNTTDADRRDGSALERAVGRPVPERAEVGDTVECDIRWPYPRTERLTLTTKRAADYASKLLADPRSGWRRARGCSECAWGKVLGCWRCGGR